MPDKKDKKEKKEKKEKKDQGNQGGGNQGGGNQGNSGGNQGNKPAVNPGKNKIGVAKPGIPKGRDYNRAKKDKPPVAGKPVAQSDTGTGGSAKRPTASKAPSAAGKPKRARTLRHQPGIGGKRISGTRPGAREKTVLKPGQEKKRFAAPKKQTSKSAGKIKAAPNPTYTPYKPKKVTKK